MLSDGHDRNPVNNFYAESTENDAAQEEGSYDAAAGHRCPGGGSLSASRLFYPYIHQHLAQPIGMLRARNDHVK